jgi:hypothetical protein
MLGKQWLNRYASTDIRGTAIERSQNRQRKLDGIVAWYFDHVMEALPLMLQVALLLLGCALTHYLWEIDITVASVVLGMTSFGIIFYIFVVVAGTASERCPYQTPGANILRHVLPHILRALRSVPLVIFELSVFVSSKLSDLIQNTWCCYLSVEWWSELERPWYSTGNITSSLFLPLVMFIGLVVDAYLLGRAILWLPVAFCRMMYRWFMDPQTHSLDQHTIALDLRCISWMLQTSLDKTVHLSTLKHLETLMSMLTEFDPALVAYCFNVFIGCININNHEVVVMQGLEQLAAVSALCFFHTISHLSVMDPTSSMLEDVRQRYTKVFPPKVDFRGHEFSHTMNVIHSVFIRSGERWRFQWSNYKPSSDEHTIVAHTLVKLVQFKYRRTGKVPRWILHFALHSLSLDPLPPTPIIADCLSIIAVDLDCDVSKTGATTLDERCVHIS